MCDIKSFFTKTQEPYSTLLERREWGAKRTRVLARDNYTCQRCGRHEGCGVALQVHHKHYIIGLDPWEYKDSELVTLCECCHNSIHHNSNVPIYMLDGDNLVQVQYTPCSRRGGAGRFPEYRHIQNGVCFRCHGAKYEKIIGVVEKYAEEHDINIDDISDGFSDVGPEIDGYGLIEEANICKQGNNNVFYVKIITEIGAIFTCFLDYSVKAEIGDKLDPHKLRYRTAVKKNGKEYIIIKGAVLQP